VFIQAVVPRVAGIFFQRRDQREIVKVSVLTPSDKTQTLGHNEAPEDDALFKLRKITPTRLFHLFPAVIMFVFRVCSFDFFAARGRP
jgi:hypothetical protein